MNQQTLKYQLLADLLATLEAEEFPIGIGKHLELQQLYSMLPEDIKAEEMKTLLAPIFAKNKQDQEFFYDIFDQSLSRVKAKTWEVSKDAPLKNIIPPKSISEILTRIFGGLLLLGVVGFIYFRSIGDEPIQMPEPWIERFEVTADSTYTKSLADFYSQKDTTGKILTKDSRIIFVAFMDGEKLGVEPNFGSYQIDSNGIFYLTMEDTVTVLQKEITIVAKYELGMDTTILIPYLLESQVVDHEEEPGEVELDRLLSTRPHPFPKSLNNLFPAQPPVWITYFQKYKTWIKGVLIFLIMALLGAWLNWWAERQQKVIADIQSKNDPPLLWNIQIPNVTKIALNEDYYQVLQLMRQRTSDDHFVLNIPQTIKKTVEKGGIVDFQYQFKTRPPEYLLLIDRQSSKNHRAYLYDYLFESFKENEVYIERFFFEGDIRLCWNEYYPNGIKLQDLQSTFRESRLIIIGTGYQMLNPVTGKLSKWTRLFDNWPDKAILSPRPTKNWGGREKQLERKFILLPASLQSLTAMVDKMEAIDPDEIRTKITDDINEPIEFRGGLIETLHHYFSVKKDGGIVDDRMVQWIAACAIYPTLHWDLTMYLGQELSTEDHNLLTVENVIQLTRLPWFIEGKIPEQARLELLEYLPLAPEMHLRKSLQLLFETIPPPNDNSVAYADSRINIALNEYLLEKNNKVKTEVDQYLRAGAEADVTMFKYLEGEKSPKDFEVDASWRKFAEGEKPKLKKDKWSMMMSYLALALSIGIFFYNPIFESCDGKLVQFKDFELCLTTPEDHLIYRGEQIQATIQHNNYEIIDSLEQVAIKEFFLFNSGKIKLTDMGKIQQEEYSVSSMLPFVKNDSSILHFYQNMAVDFYNHGVPFYNKFDSSGTSFKEYTSTQPDTVNFCVTFGEANYYDKLIKTSSLGDELIPILEEFCNSYLMEIKKVDDDRRATIVKLFSTSESERKNANTKLLKVYRNDRMLVPDILSFAIGKGNDRVKEEFINSIYHIIYILSTLDNTSLASNKTQIEQFFDAVEQLGIGSQTKKTINGIRNKMDFSKVDKKTEIDLEDVLLKATTCYKDNIAIYRKNEKQKNYEIAYQFLLKAGNCNIGNAEKIELEKLKKELKKELTNNSMLLDSRDGQIYKTVKIGNQTWLAENLNYKTIDSRCYDDAPENCEKYGSLYNPKNAANICMSGWRVPSDADFKYILNQYGGGYVEMKDVLNTPASNADQTRNIKTYESFVPGGNSGFAWTLGGGFGNNYFGDLNKQGGYFTSAPISYFGMINDGKEQAIIREEEADSDVQLISCRCVKGPVNSVSPSTSQQQSSGNAVPTSTNLITLEVEFLNQLTKQFQPGYQIEINGIDPQKITTLRSGAQFITEVEEGKEYIINAKLKNGIVESKTIIAKPNSKTGRMQVALEVGLPVREKIKNRKLDRKIKVTLVRLVCEMSDEGPGNDADMDRFKFTLNASQTACKDGKDINLTGSGKIIYNYSGAEITTPKGHVWKDTNQSVTISIENELCSKLNLSIDGYARDRDDVFSGADEEAIYIFQVPSNNSFGDFSFKLRSSDFIYRCEFKIEKVGDW